MDDSSLLQSAFPGSIRSRSMGLKLIVVCTLALLMSVPAFFVESLLEERTQREADVVREISSHVGGQQTFLGPTLTIPYSIPAQTLADISRSGMYVVFPMQASATIKTSTEERHRSLFKVPVFQADVKMDAVFDLTGVPVAAPQGADLDWNRAEIVVGVSDARGAMTDGVLAIDGKNVMLVPAQITQNVDVGNQQSQGSRLTLFGGIASAVAKPKAKFNVTSTLRFSGAQRIAMLAYGKTTHLTMQGDWPNPGFDGGFLPVNRTITASSYGAEWSVPFIARGVPAEGPGNAFSGLDATALGVSFIELADPYQSVNRSIKYLLLFLGLIFLSYFVFEVTTGKRVHPAQYALVGVAQIIFYLLLLSFAERIGFDGGFLVAGMATVILLSANAGWVFASRAQAAKALVVNSLLYLLIYLMLRLEDNALLVGAITSFVVVAAAMYMTRNIDWYGSMPQTSTLEPQQHPPASAG